MHFNHRIRPYKLEIKALIFYVSALCIFLFSGVLYIFRVTDHGKLIDLLWDYGTIVAPITLLWILLEKRLWRSRLLQNLKTYLNIPPDLRGRWEGYLASSKSPKEQRTFTIEVEQTLTTLNVTSYSSFGNSKSILAEIGSDEKEELFSMCYLWQGEINNKEGNAQHIQQFNGYTMLHYHRPLGKKEIDGTYFTDLQPEQTHGTIHLKWVSYDLQKQL